MADQVGAGTAPVAARSPGVTIGMEEAEVIRLLGVIVLIVIVVALLLVFGLLDLIF